MAVVIYLYFYYYHHKDSIGIAKLDTHLTTDFLFEQLEQRIWEQKEKRD